MIRKKEEDDGMMAATVAQADGKLHKKPAPGDVTTYRHRREPMAFRDLRRRIYFSISSMGCPSVLPNSKPRIFA